MTHQLPSTTRHACHRVTRAAVVTAVAVLALSMGAAAFAQSTYPNRPVKLVVGFAASGPTDILARVVGGGMSKVLGEQMIIENRVGSGGNIATEAASRADPDGYTLLMTLMSTAINESLFKDFKIKMATHYEPIGGMAQTGLVLVVHPSLDVKSVGDLIKLAQAKPGALLYASAGAGTATHLAAELFNARAGTKMMPVHYKGGGDTIRDLLSGEVKIMFSTVPPVVSLVKEGKLRGIATTGARRDGTFPDLPTVMESGVAGFDVPLWFGMAAPKGTPRPIIERLGSALKQTLTMPDIQQALSKHGFTPMQMDAQTFGKFYADEAAKWAQVVNSVGLNK